MAKPISGPNGFPFSVGGKPAAGTTTCSCCADTINSCESALACLKRRDVLLNLDLEVGGGPGSCVSFPDAGIGPTLWYEPGGYTPTGCAFPPSFYPWQYQRTPAMSRLQPIIDNEECSLFVCNSAISAECTEGGHILLAWHFAYINCGCPGPIDSAYYYPCEFECTCGTTFNCMLQADPIHWTDLKTMLQSARFDINFEICTEMQEATCKLIGTGSTAVGTFFGKPPCGVACDDCEGTPPIISKFEICKLPGCRYDITYEIESANPTACPLAIAWLEVTGDEGIEGSVIEVPIEPNQTDGSVRLPSVKITSECGGHGGSDSPLTLHVMDECGCCTESSIIFSCCNCVDGNGDPCPPGQCYDCASSGTVVLTETGPCEFELCGSGVGCGYYEYQLIQAGGSCYDNGDGEFCPCGDYEGCGDNPTDSDDYSACGQCFGTIGNNCATFNIDRPGYLRWRFMEGVCGCPGEWTEPVALPCAKCECCFPNLGGIVVTIDGIGEGEAEDPDCDCNGLYNGSYFLPFVDECHARLTLNDTITCSCSSPPCEYDLDIQVFLFCYEGTGPGGTDQIEIFGYISSPPIGDVEFYTLKNVGDAPIDCTTELDGCLTNMTGGGPCDFFPCCANSATMCLDFTE